MSEILIVGRLKIHAGKLDEFKKLVHTCVETAREMDSGTLQYDWFFNADQSACILLERYGSSEACLEHMANVGETMQALFATANVSGDIVGNPSDAMVNALAGMNIPVYRYFEGR